MYERIDVLTEISGVGFEEAWINRIEFLKENLLIPIIGKMELIRNKEASGRPSDLIDVQKLKAS